MRRLPQLFSVEMPLLRISATEYKGEEGLCPLLVGVRQALYFSEGVKSAIFVNGPSFTTTSPTSFVDRKGGGSAFTSVTNEIFKLATGLPFFPSTTLIRMT